MSVRKSERKTIERPQAVVRDKQYYLNTLDIEASLLKKATDIAERMMVAFMRENKVEVSVNVDDIADKIIAQLAPKLQSHVISGQIPSPVNLQNGFDYDDGPVVLKTDKIEVKGKVSKESKSGDSISDNLDALEGIQI